MTAAADIDHPVTGAQAQFSARFAVAARLRKGDDALPHRYRTELLADNDMRSIMRRIIVRADRALDAGYPDRRGARATIRLRDGRELSGEIVNARGEPELPLDGREIEAKFMSLAADWFGAETDELRDRLLGLEAEEDVSSICAIVFRAAKRAAGEQRSVDPSNFN